MSTALDRVLAVLRCPRCAAPLERDPAALRCATGHSYDVARQGYVNLATGARGPRTGDTAAMVAARDTFLGTDHFRPIIAAVGAAVDGATGDGVVIDVAGGTGRYLSAGLDAAPGRSGICLDLSAAALRRAARAHPRAAAVGADVWQGLPLVPGCAAVALSIFGPRNGDELVRVLGPDGRLVVVSPRADHLRELVQPLGLIGVDPDKTRREQRSFAGFDAVDDQDVRYPVTMSHDHAHAAIAMGPSAARVDAEELSTRLRLLPDPLEVTVAVRVAVYRPRVAAAGGTPRR